jgi:hypothetical protein
VSMVSLDLARRLKLKLKSGKQLRVSGLGGIPTVITASAEVKITLGPRVVYIFGTLGCEHRRGSGRAARDELYVFRWSTTLCSRRTCPTAG